MNNIPIAAVPNQALFVQLDGRAYTIALHSTGANVVAVDITRDDVRLVTGARVMPGAPLLPYRYQESGNFVLVTDDGDLPDYQKFGATQFLTYVTADELDALRA